jgi:hypothetical protein
MKAISALNYSSMGFCVSRPAGRFSFRLPRIGRSLSADVPALQWVINAYCCRSLPFFCSGAPRASQPRQGHDYQDLLTAFGGQAQSELK